MKHTFRKPILILVILAGCYISITSSAKSSASTEEFEYTYYVNNIEYSGLYTGETVNGLPSGKGEFIADSNSPFLFSYSGEFKDGFFDGEGTYTYPNESYLECTFASGIPVGKGTITYPDHSYMNIEFSDIGIPFGPASTYSADNQLIDYSFYNNGELLTTLIQDAQQIDYKDLYRMPDNYYGVVMKIHGTILHVYEDSSYCTFKIQDQNENIYWGSYHNNTYSKYNQAIMPTLKTGDVITLYAFSKGLTSYSCIDDTEQYNTLLPEVSAITAQLEDEVLDYNSLSYDYDNVLRFPYHYVKQPAKIKGHIISLIKINNRSYIKVSDSKNNIYYISPKKKKDLKSLLPGDLISVEGYYNGLYKEYNSTTIESAHSSPLIKATESVRVLN